MSSHNFKHKNKCFQILLNELEQQYSNNSKSRFWNVIGNMAAIGALIYLIYLLFITLKLNNGTINEEFDHTVHIIEAFKWCMTLLTFIWGNKFIDTKKIESNKELILLEEKLKNYIDFNTLSSSKKDLLIKECEQLLKK